MNNLLCTTDWLYTNEQSELWKTFMLFVCVVLGGRDNKTGIKMICFHVLN